MTYAELVEKAREIYESEDTPHVFKAWLLANIIGPADENEDERIRKELIEHIKANKSADYVLFKRFSPDDVIAWLEKQGEKSTIIDVDKMVMEYSQTRDGDFGLPVNCMIKAYKKGINDALKLSLNLEKQGEQIELKKVEQDNHPRIVMADFNGGEGFYKLNLDNLNKEQVDAIEMLLTNSKKISDYDLHKRKI